jgi:asparagine synthase (glutamine-hydrolysing)
LSGFVGIFNLDGAPVDRELLTRLTGLLAFRGPDAEAAWCDGAVGMGHALLRATREAAEACQPTSLSGRLAIVADARIDARDELIDRLNAKRGAGCRISPGTDDAELILHAYDVWGEGCVERLIGDFSFAIWDAGRRRLFCGRDHFGVKPFYFAQVDACVVFSNTLDCLMEHPAISHRLNELAIADFLLFDMSRDPAATSFAEIRRLPPAHILQWGATNVSARRYWTLPVATPMDFRRREECVERFRELLDAAVADRLRVDRAGVLMSGGLDSPTVAASAQRIFSGGGRAGSLRAYTEVFESLIPHQERRYATLAANALHMPIEFLVSDHRRLFDRADDPEDQSADPIHLAWPDTAVDQLRQVAAESRVALTGFGADPAFSSLLSVHFRQLVKARRFGRAVADASRYLLAEGRLSRLYLRTRWSRWFAGNEPWAQYPPWLDEEFERRWNLRDRWRETGQTASFPQAVRPEAYEVLLDPFWPNLFERCDAGATRVPVEIRHPFFDLRLMSFLLALPRLPWCSDKQLLREAARGVLPDPVRLRRKSPLAEDPAIAALRRPESAWVDGFEPVSELAHYVVRKRIPAVYQERDSWTAWIHLRPLSLNFWLRGAGPGEKLNSRRTVAAGTPQ